MQVYKFTIMKLCSLVVVYLKVFCLNYLTEATLTEKVTQNYLWDGVVAYLAVDRQVIQDKLDAWHESISSACGGPRLHLPNSSVFPGIIDENQHVVYIGTGYVDFYDFQTLRSECISTHGMEFAVTIPLLADHPDGIPHYSLALKNFYERGRGDIPKPNIALPYEPVDEITRDETSIVMRDGDDELRLSFGSYSDQCKPSNPVVLHEFNEYLEEDLHFGVSEPDFSFCDRHPVDNHYCMIVKSIKCQVHRSSPNICQTSWKAPRKSFCESAVQIVNITQGFRDMLLLGDDELNVVASEAYFGNISLGLKYPCIE